MTAYRSFDDVPPLAYDLIMADPPWSFDNYSAKGEAKNAKAHYRCAGVDDISTVQVSSFASKDCLLWLWATNPMLPQALDLMARWGFAFVTAGHWSKKTASGKQAFGTGYVLRSAGEPFLIGKIGRPVTTRGVRSVIEGVAREHSRKPDEAYDAAEALIPNARRLDLYSRQERPGWDCAGDEVGKFAGEAA